MVNKQIQFINKIDERGRFCGLEAQLIPCQREVMQRNDSQFSYMNRRAFYASHGETMGLSKSITEYMLNSFGRAVGIKRK